ncbi:hypothetical protein QB940_002925 [Salmonella enterica]|nr:hypothetical protein [Salmonella enterica]EKS5204281.1 hypothetical protein [Salmonella enterica]
MIKFNSNGSLELDKYQINLNSVDYTELPATSKRARFLHARVDFYDGSKTTPSRPCLTLAFCHQKDEIRSFDTNQHVASLSIVLSPARTGSALLQKFAISGFRHKS